jgi:hypothetical protein
MLFFTALLGTTVKSYSNYIWQGDWDLRAHVASLQGLERTTTMWILRHSSTLLRSEEHHIMAKSEVLFWNNLSNANLLIRLKVWRNDFLTGLLQFFSFTAFDGIVAVCPWFINPLHIHAKYPFFQSLCFLVHY